MIRLQKLNRSEGHPQYGENNPLSESDWNSFRNTLSNEASISDAYKQFMLTYNGGVFKESVFMNDPQGPVVTSTFFPISKTEKNSINSHIIYFSKEVGSNYIPIADDPGGNYFLLDCSKERSGSVHFWDHENGKIVELSSSFEEFINYLLIDD